MFSRVLVHFFLDFMASLKKGSLSIARVTTSRKFVSIAMGYD